jgi:CRISPR/Cas system-associated exonuclease Cas4 (RecB family)
MAGIRSQETGFEIWAQSFTQGHREEVQRAVLRIRQIIDGEAIPVGTRNRRKCQACRLGLSCDVRAG